MQLNAQRGVTQAMLSNGSATAVGYSVHCRLSPKGAGPEWIKGGFFKIQYE